VLLVHACQVPILPAVGRCRWSSSLGQGGPSITRQCGQTAWHSRQQCITFCSSRSTRPGPAAVPLRKAELTVLGHDHPALGGRMPFGHMTSTIASMSPSSVVAVSRSGDPISRRPSPDDRTESIPQSAPMAMPSLRQASPRSPSFCSTRAGALACLGGDYTSVAARALARPAFGDQPAL
jgi:hypothetical protein